MLMKIFIKEHWERLDRPAENDVVVVVDKGRPT